MAQNDTTRRGNFTAAGRRYAVGIGLRRSLYVNGLCKSPNSSGVRQVFRAERPKPQPPHVYYYCHQNFSYFMDRPPFPCTSRIFPANHKVNRRNRSATHHGSKKQVRMTRDAHPTKTAEICTVCGKRNRTEFAACNFLVELGVIATGLLSSIIPN